MKTHLDNTVPLIQDVLKNEELHPGWFENDKQAGVEKLFPGNIRKPQMQSHADKYWRSAIQKAGLGDM